MECKKCKHFDWSCNACDHDAGPFCDMEVVEILMKFFPDAPCNYNGMDEFADDDFCCENCGTVSADECWLHAIKAKWYERGREE